MCINRSFALPIFLLGLTFGSANGMNSRRLTATYRIKKANIRTQPSAVRPRVVRRSMTNMDQNIKPAIEIAKISDPEEFVLENSANENALKKIDSNYWHQLKLKREYTEITQKINAGKPWWMILRSQEKYNQLMENKRNNIYNQLVPRVTNFDGLTAKTA